MLEVDLIADYLIENSYASTTKNAYNLISCMSDDWMTSILEDVEDFIVEMRKEDKVKGKKKTPLITGTTTRSSGDVRMVRGPEGGPKWIKRDTRQVHQYPQFNIQAAMARQKQGMPATPVEHGGSVIHKDYGVRYLDPKGYVRHAHGGGETGVEPGMLRGRSRTQLRAAEESGNVRVPNADTSKGPRVKRRGPRPSETSTGRIRRRLENEKIKQQQANVASYRDSFYEKPKPRDLITRYPKLNLPQPKTKTVNRKTARNKLGAAKTGSQVLAALEKLSKKP